MKDQTNSKNIKMMLAYVLIFFVCIIIVIVMSVFFGMKQYSGLPGPCDRPRTSICFHDHRV